MLEREKNLKNWILNKKFYNETVLGKISKNACSHSQGRVRPLL